MTIRPTLPGEIQPTQCVRRRQAGEWPEKADGLLPFARRGATQRQIQPIVFRGPILLHEIEARRVGPGAADQIHYGLPVSKTVRRDVFLLKLVRRSETAPEGIRCRTTEIRRSRLSSSDSELTTPLAMKS